MSYEVVENFAAGLDTRKSALTAPAGTLTKLINAAINPGGEIEKRRAFVKIGTNVLAGTFGLAATEATLHCFTRNADVTVPPALAAANVKMKFQKIPNAAADLQQLDFDTFDGKIYLACIQPSGAAEGDSANAPKRNPHYYDGVLTEGSGKGYYVRTYQSKVYSVIDKYLYFSAINNPVLWNPTTLIGVIPVTQLSNANPAVCTVALGDIGHFYATQKVEIAGASDTGMTSANGIQTVGAVDVATGTFTLSGVDTSSATAPQTTGLTVRPAVIVTSLSASNPAVCTVNYWDIGKFSNGMTVNVKGAAVAGANGAHEITNVNSPANTFTLVDVSTASGAVQTTGVTVTQIDDLPRTGAGFINLSLQDSESEFLTSLEVYYDQLAIFSSEAVQIWAVDPDPLQNAYVQLLRGTGTTAPRSTSQYGSGDVLYLDASGVRSLRARDSSNSAAVNDIGSPIDRLLTVPLVTGFDQATAVLEPLIGRFWLVFPNIIYVLSYFPGPKITAWSEYIPGFTIDYAVSSAGKLWFRSGDDLYAYGGSTDGLAFDSSPVEVRLPYLSGKKPGHNKNFEAVDLSIAGTWEVRVSYDFNNVETEEVVGTFTQSTWNGGRAELTGYGSHISMRFHNASPGPAVLSNVAVHFQVVDDEQ